MNLQTAAQWALAHFVNADRSNAAMHCAPVRYSPITFRLAEALDDIGAKTPDIEAVLADRGAYEEDAGR